MVRGFFVVRNQGVEKRHNIRQINGLPIARLRRHKLMKKLDAKNSAELVRYASANAIAIKE
jgi:hypothetical protein